MRIYGKGTSLALSSTFRGSSSSLLFFDAMATTTDVDELGYDTLVRTYRFRRDQLSKYKPLQGDVDFEFQSMAYWKHHEARKRDFIEVNITYTGYREPRPRVVKSEWDVRLMEMPLVDISSGAQIGLVYYGGTVTSRYASPTRPGNSEGFAAQPDLSCDVIAIRGSGGVQLSNPRAVGQALIRNFGVKVRAVRSSFPRKPQGGVWICEETVDAAAAQESVIIKL